MYTGRVCLASKIIWMSAVFEVLWCYWNFYLHRRLLLETRSPKLAITFYHVSYIKSPLPNGSIFLLICDFLFFNSPRSKHYPIRIPGWWYLGHSSVLDYGPLCYMVLLLKSLQNLWIKFRMRHYTYVQDEEIISIWSLQRFFGIPGFR